MADGTVLNPGVAGDKIDTEDFGARGKCPRSKLVLGALDVDGGDVAVSNPLPVTVGNFPGTQPVSGTVTANQGGAPWSNNLTQLAGTAVDVNSGTKSAGTLRVVLATDQPQLTNKLLVTPDPITFASAQAVTQSGTWTVQPGNTPNTTPWLTTQTPATSGGCSTYSYIAAASANQDSQSVKGSAGQLYGFDVFNTTASIRYVKLYNKATAPTSSDTPVRRIMVPANGGAVRDIVNGAVFSLGIGVRITTGSADADTGAATAGDVVVNLDYK